MNRLICAPAFCAAIVLAAAWSRGESLPPGFVQGDVVSYSYVPIRTWTPDEGIGILPYLFEYYLTQWDSSLAAYHDENVRRIDIVSQWSTAIALNNRESDWRDEVINLMIRCFRNRQLIILGARPSGKKNYHQNMIDILDHLWSNRDTYLTDPEGDRATGRQLINNILAGDVGDEEECGLGTTGMQQRFARYDQEIRLRVKDGQQPFRHIKCWFNMMGYVYSCYAANRQDVDDYGRVQLPPNTQAIGVDMYHYWFHTSSPYDPADLSIPRSSVRNHSDEWQRLRTRYYPQGLDMFPCPDASDPAYWIPECWNDTHALMGGIDLAGASGAMMWYIAVCGQLGPSVGSVTTYTTPIETMESYYDHLKAGPWVAVSWWVFGTNSTCHGGLEYYDKTLAHYTPEHPEGIPYSSSMLDYWHDEYVALKMRMFNDVVHNQFGYLNPLAPVIDEVSPDPERVPAGASYDRQLTLQTGSTPCTWTVVAGPAGLNVDANGYVSGWTPDASLADQTVTITVQVSNGAGSDDETWQVLVEPLPPGVIAFFPFNTDAEGWTLEGWRSGSFAAGTMDWISSGGLPAGHLVSAGSGETNNDNNCTREGGLMTRLISTAGHDNIRIEYHVMAGLHTPPAAGCSGACGSGVVDGSCEDKLAVYYSTTGTGGPWTLAQVLTEGTDLPSVWTRRIIDLAAVPAAANNPSFALRFKWQFNTVHDGGRLDDVIVRSTSFDINAAPQVDAGPDQVVVLPSSVNLDGTVHDDHLPDPPRQVTVTWSRQSGPGPVTFGDPNAVDTTAAFSQAGVYVLRLTAGDSDLSAYDDVTVTVHPDEVPDYDLDGDVDLEDFGHFQRCLGGNHVPAPAGCSGADFDGDNDVDQEDFARFKSCMGGANNAPSC